MVDLRVEHFLEQIAGFFERHSRSEFMSEAMLIKLRDTYLRYGLKEKDSADLKKIIAEADADFRGLKGAERIKRISRMLETVERDRTLKSFNA